jgi:hypothetical protein
MALTQAARSRRYRARRKRKLRVVEVLLSDSAIKDLVDFGVLDYEQLKSRTTQEMLGNLLFAGAVLRHVWRGRPLQEADLEVT